MTNKSTLILIIIGLLLGFGFVIIGLEHAYGYLIQTDDEKAAEANAANPCLRVIICDDSENYYVNGSFGGDDQLSGSYTITPGYTDNSKGCALPGDRARADLDCNGEITGKEQIQYWIDQGTLPALP